MEDKMDDKGSVKIKVPGLGALRKNPWILATVVLAIALIVSIFYGSFGGSGSASSSVASDNLVKYINSLGKGTASVVSSTKDNGMYNIVVSYNNQKIPVYVTIDGNYLITDRIPLTAKAGVTGNVVQNQQAQQAQQPKQEVVKSDKPKVELFVMSYCPFGTQMEKGILPVLNALGSKIDAKIRFVHYTMHGEKEDTENFRQLCIREEQGSKYLSYLQCILNSTSQSAPADINQCMAKVGIDSAKVTSCMSGKAKDYYASDSALSKQYGVQGSPTLVINGAQVDSARSPAAILNTICLAFNNKPAECSKVLPSDSPSAGFGYQSGGADSAAANCGV